MQSLPLLPVMLATSTALLPAHGAGHSLAVVNDPRSHGQVGDAFLSLNEVILINKRALSITSLSAAEQAQILGFGPDVAYADIDATVVPKITLERDLDVIADTAHGLVISGTKGTPTIDLNGTKGFVLDSNFADLRNLVIENAQVAVTLRQTDAIFGTVVENVTFRSIGSTAIQAHYDATDGYSRLQVESCRFLSVPVAMEVFDLGARRSGELLVLDSTFQGGTLGTVVHLGPQGSLNVTLERTDYVATTAGIVFVRGSPSDDRKVVLSALHANASGGTDGLSFQGTPTSGDSLTLRMCDLAGQQHALQVWPLGSRTSTVYEDGRLSGSTQILGGSSNASVLLANVRANGGTLTLGSTGASVGVTDTILTNVTMATTGSAPVTVGASRLENGSAAGSATAPLQVSQSYVGQTTLGPHVSVTGTLPAPQLGSMDVSPLTPTIGSSVNLQADLPPGLSGFWVVGLAETYPYIGPRPLHLYFWLTAYIPVPGVVRGQTTTKVPLPNNRYLVGWDFVAQIAVVPDPGSSAPSVSLPPGRRFVLQ